MREGTKGAGRATKEIEEVGQSNRGERTIGQTSEETEEAGRATKEIEGRELLVKHQRRLKKLAGQSKR
ncbi:hypothetical protein RRG08_019600 [Elysia crispata]|uniref:Uncharacterized protein n=1 Tax=Elysia crispata TaxID=231223 RepID=A0AAE1AX31_9GAST|nr:hypothetical protein RRG08_019600 [Elysia crispata]